MARELIARNSLHLLGERTLDSPAPDSRPVVLAQDPKEKTHCMC